jgi:hypothetical protein
MKKNKAQADLFAEDIALKSRGMILTERIWDQLNVHQKINIRFQYIEKWYNRTGRKDKCSNNICDIVPNNMCISPAFENGFDMSPFVLQLSRCHYHFMQAQIRNVTPK